MKSLKIILDIDECTTSNPCQQNCKNTAGSYQCLCQAGYKTDPKDSKKCLATCKKYGCVNGECSKPDVCKCYSGYQGNNCTAGNIMVEKTKKSFLYVFI